MSSRSPRGSLEDIPSVAPGIALRHRAVQIAYLIKDYATVGIEAVGPVGEGVQGVYRPVVGFCQLVNRPASQAAS